jgi:tetratricopeptide (TPR) repeat protein
MRVFKFLALYVIFSLVSFAMYSQQISLADSLIKTLENHFNRDTLRADLLNRLAYELYLNDPDKSLGYAHEAISIGKELNYPKAEAQGQRQIGLVFWAQSNYANALKCFVSGLKLAEEARDPQTVADITGNIGLVYQGLGDYREALTHHLHALEMQRDLKNEIREAVALNNVGDANKALGDYDRAIECYEGAIAIRTKYKNLIGIATNLRNIGNVMEEKNKLAEALSYYQRSQFISDSLADNRGMSQCRQAIGSVFFKMKKYTNAKKFASEALTISRESNFRSSIRDAYLLLSQIAEARNDLIEAFSLFKLHSQYKDSLVNLRVGSEIASYRLDYETQKKQQEIASLKREAITRDSLIDQKNTQLIFVVITLILIISLASVLFRSNNKQRRTNEMLESKNKKIEEQHRELALHRDELIALNEEIRAQQEDAIDSRDALAEKNIAIAEMNEKILSINENLEKIINARTAAIEKQNRQLIEYSFINAHRLRAPLARILGLANLVQLTPQSEEQAKLITLLQQSAHELDEVTRSISRVVQEGLEAYDRDQKESTGN